MKYRNSNDRKLLNSDFPILVLLLITLCSVINKKFFYQYSNFALYVNLAISVGGLFIVNNYKTTTIYIVCFTVYLLDSIMVNGGGVGSVITFIIPFLLFTYISNVGLTDFQVKTIRIMCSIVLIYEFIFSFRYAENYRFYALSDVNPNTVGMYLMFTFMLWSALMDLSNRITIILFIIGLTMSLLGMYNCESRGTSFALIVYCLLILLPIKMISSKKIMILVIFIILGGTAFPFIYISLYRNGVNFEMFGKTLYTGREGIWLNMFEAMNENFTAQIFGLGSKIELWQEHSLNVHNNYFNIIVNFGIIGYILYFSFILHILYYLTKHYQDRMIYKLTMMFVSSVLILGFTETTSLWAVIFVFVFISIGVASSRVNIKMKL